MLSVSQHTFVTLDVRGYHHSRRQGYCSPACCESQHVQQSRNCCWTIVHSVLQEASCVGITPQPQAGMCGRSPWFRMKRSEEYFNGSLKVSEKYSSIFLSFFIPMMGHFFSTYSKTLYKEQALKILDRPEEILPLCSRKSSANVAWGF